MNQKRPPLSTHLKRILLGWRPARRPGDRESAFCALYVAGPAHSVSKRIGDNMGCWPIRFGTTGAWQDEITSRLEWASPIYWQGLLFRVWCSSVTSAQVLESLVRAELEDRYDGLRKAWVDFGPNLDVQELERAIRLVAADHGIQTWNDAELVKHLEKLDKDATDKVRRIKARVT
jgi:hypothetical protein